MNCNNTSFDKTILQDQNAAFQRIGLTDREYSDIFNILKWANKFNYIWEWGSSVCYSVKIGILRQYYYIIKHHQSNINATLWDYDRRVPYTDEFQRLDIANFEIWQELSKQGIKIVVPMYSTNSFLISKFIKSIPYTDDTRFEEKRKNCKNIINSFLDKKKAKKDPLWEDIYFDNKIDNFMSTLWYMYLIDPFMWNGNWCE